MALAIVVEPPLFEPALNTALPIEELEPAFVTVTVYLLSAPANILNLLKSISPPCSTEWSDIVPCIIVPVVLVLVTEPLIRLFPDTILKSPCSILVSPMTVSLELGVVVPIPMFWFVCAVRAIEFPPYMWVFWSLAALKWVAPPAISFISFVPNNKWVSVSPVW